jgi:hypothetical protein
MTSQTNLHRLPRFCFDELTDQMSFEDITGERVDACVRALSFKNLDFVPKRLAFVLELVTRRTWVWTALLNAANERYWFTQESCAAALYEAEPDCGYVRLYFLQEEQMRLWRRPQGSRWTTLPNLDALYLQLDTQAALHVHQAWVQHQSQVTELPTVFVEGRMNNTQAARGLILSSGNGCSVCGRKATACAATTIGAGEEAAIASVAVCDMHLDEAKRHPCVLAFIASIFSMRLDLPALVWTDCVPDELVPFLQAAVADKLAARTASAEKRRRGWHLRFMLPTGWSYLLRINTLTDYAYMLLDPAGNEAFRADSSPDHPELAFFPHHQHSMPNRRRDVVTPSFLYGLPLFDTKLLRRAAYERGAYGVAST